MKTQAIVFPEPKKIEFRDVETIDLVPGRALVRTIVSLVSLGTENRVFDGNQVGATFPLVPGYSAVGVVEEVCGEIPGIKPGALVFSGGAYQGFKDVECWSGGHSRHLAAEAHKLVPIDDRRSPAEYAFTKIAAISLRGCRFSFTEPGDRVVIVGDGIIGLLAAKIFGAWGREVIIGGHHDWRLEKAPGVLRTVNTHHVDLAEVVNEMCPDGVMCAVEATSRQENIDLCAEMLHTPDWDEEEPRQPMLLLLGSYMDRISFHGRVLFTKEHLVINSRNNMHSDLVAAAQMIRSGALTVKEMITLRARPEDAAEALREVFYGHDKHFTCIFEWE